jgi:hypothetical protein
MVDKAFEDVSDKDDILGYEFIYQGWEEIHD